MKKTGGTVEISAVTSYNDYDAVHLCMLQRIQDITIFELTYVMDKPEMEEILYESKKGYGINALCSNGNKHECNCSFCS